MKSIVVTMAIRTADSPLDKPSELINSVLTNHCRLVLILTPETGALHWPAIPVTIPIVRFGLLDVNAGHYAESLFKYTSWTAIAA